MESAQTLATHLAAGRTRATDIAAAALEQAHQGEGKRTFLKIYDEWARDLAALSDHVRARGLARSPIEGLTVSIKDLFDVCGEITRSGSKVLNDAPPASKHAEVVDRLLHAGAVLVGRTNMVEFAYSGLGLNPHYGTPANPWNREARLIPGGSSSGAAISVADNMSSAAIGSDTGGSCRIPAALCGLVGFKPTAARVSTAGVLPLSKALDSIGVIARDVQSCVLFDGVIAHHAPTLREGRIHGARFAVPETIVLDDMDRHVSSSFESTLDLLGKLGADIQRIQVPEFATLADINSHGGFAAAESWAWHAPLLGARQSEYDPRVASRIARGAGLSALDLLKLTEARHHWMAAVSTRFQAYDAILMPTVPVVAPRISTLEADETLYFQTNALMLRNPSFINFLDGCAISIPCHVPGTAPVGLSICGNRFADEQVLGWARAIENAITQHTASL